MTDKHTQSPHCVFILFTLLNYAIHVVLSIKSTGSCCAVSYTGHILFINGTGYVSLEVCVE